MLLVVEEVVVIVQLHQQVVRVVDQEVVLRVILL